MRLRATLLMVYFWILILPSASFASDLVHLKVVSAKRSYNTFDSEKFIEVQLDDNSKDIFAKWTILHVGKRINVMIDGRVFYKPRLATPIMGGEFGIGGVPDDEIDSLRQKLSDGVASLAVEIED